MGFPQSQGSQDFGTMQSQLAVEHDSIHSSFLHTLVRVRGTSFSFEVLYKHSQQHRLAKGGQSVGQSQGQIRVAQRERGRL